MRKILSILGVLIIIGSFVISIAFLMLHESNRRSILKLDTGETIICKKCISTDSGFLKVITLDDKMLYFPREKVLMVEEINNNNNNNNNK